MRAAAAEGVVSGALDDLEPAYEAAMARVRGEEPEDGAGKVGTTANGGRVGGGRAGSARAGQPLHGPRNPKESSSSSSSSAAAEATTTAAAAAAAAAAPGRGRAVSSSSAAGWQGEQAASDARWQELLQQPGLRSARLELRAERLARLQHGNEEANVDASPLHSGPPRCFLRVLDVLARGWEGYHAALDQDLSRWAVDRVLGSTDGPGAGAGEGAAEAGSGGGGAQRRRAITLRRRTDVAAARLRVMMGQALPEEALLAQQRHEERLRQAAEEEAKADMEAATELMGRALVQEIATGCAPRAFAAACLMPNECAPLPLPAGPPPAARPRSSGSLRRRSKRRRAEPADEEVGDGAERLGPPGPGSCWDALAGTVPSALVDPMAGLRARATDPSDPAAACAMELVLCTGEAMPAARARRAAALDRILSPAGFVLADFGLPDVPGVRRTKVRGAKQRELAKQVRDIMAAAPYPGDPRPPYSGGTMKNSAKAKRARRGGGPAQLHRNPSDELLRAVDLLLLPSTMATPSQRSQAIQVMLDAVAPISCGGVTSRDPPASAGWQRERAGSMDAADEPDAAACLPAGWAAGGDDRRPDGNAAAPAAARPATVGGSAHSAVVP